MYKDCKVAMLTKNHSTYVSTHKGDNAIHKQHAM